MTDEQRATEGVGGGAFLVCLFFNCYFLRVSVVPSAMISFFFVVVSVVPIHVVVVVRAGRSKSSGTAEECSLHSDRVNGWMDG